MENVRLDEGVINNLPSGEVVQSDNLIAIWQDGKTVKVPVSHLSGSENIVFINPVQINSNTQAHANNRYLADTTNGSFTLTLPSAPVVGDYIEILDSHDKFNVNNLIIACNGYKISGVLEDVIVDLKRISVALTYVSDVWGWFIDIKLTEYDHLISKGKDGKDGKSAYELWVSYGNFGKTYEDFLAAFKGSDGVDGKDGKDGYTPKKGVDYFDGANGLRGLTGERGRDGRDGVNGYTPVKGLDYFDGIDGYTPIKGVDYFDGVNGSVGPNTVSTTTNTNITGLVTGNGTKISSIAFPNDNTKYLDGTGTFSTITVHNTVPINTSNSISDILLKIGEIAYVDYSNTTSVPLNIAVEEGIYEVNVIGIFNGTAGAEDYSRLYPNNNTSNISADFTLVGHKDGTDGSNVTQTWGNQNGFPFGLTLILHSKFTISTYTNNKNIVGQAMFKRLSNSIENLFFNSFWSNTTTPWTSLGTITFFNTQSGKIVIKRII